MIWLWSIPINLYGRKCPNSTNIHLFMTKSPYRFVGKYRWQECDKFEMKIIIDLIQVLHQTLRSNKLLLIWWFTPEPCLNFEYEVNIPFRCYLQIIGANMIHMKWNIWLYLNEISHIILKIKCMKHKYLT